MAGSADVASHPGPSRPAKLPALSESPTRSQLPVYCERTADGSYYNSRGLGRVGQRCTVLDFSFLHLQHPLAALTVEPRRGRVFQRKKPPPPPDGKEDGPALQKGASRPDPHNLMVFSDNNTGKTQVTQDGFVVMRAKEETYAFKENKAEKVISKDKDMMRFELDSEGNLVEKKGLPEEELPDDRLRYRCTSLRFDNNRFVPNALASLGAFMRNLLYKPEANLVHIDLSCNRIVMLPDSFPPCPLHTLLLHNNKIAEMREVEKLQQLHLTLRKLTLNGNPLQAAERRSYKYAVLFHLPFLTSLDDVHITPRDRDALVTFENIFVPKGKRGQTRKFLALPAVVSGSTSPSLVQPSASPPPGPAASSLGDVLMARSHAVSPLLPKAGAR